MTTVATITRPRMSALQQAMLSFYWFATSVQWAAILTILMQLQVLDLVSADVKGQTLGLVLAFGALVSMFIAPFFGAWSDRVATRWGRRTPFLVVGTLGNMLGLLGMAYLPSVRGALALPLYIGAFMWVQLFNNIATAPFSALIPDIVPPDQRGSASGWLGLMTMLGNFGGAAVIPLALASIGGVVGAYWVIIVVMLLGMAVTVFSVKEPPAPPAPPFEWGAFVRGLYEPLRTSHDFRWVFWTRFLVTMGIFTVQQFLLFYFIDVIREFRFMGASNFLGVIPLNQATDAASVFFLMLLVGAIISSLLAGVLSDKYGRKLMVYISGALQGLVAAVFIFFGDYTLAVLMGLVFGLGYGAYQAVDWALAADVLPSTDDYAKDMGVWHVALTLPQVIATPIAGFLLDRFQIIGKGSGLPTLGYMVIFALAVIYFALGTYFVRRIRVVK